MQLCLRSLTSHNQHNFNKMSFNKNFFYFWNQRLSTFCHRKHTFLKHTYCVALNSRTCKYLYGVFPYLSQQQSKIKQKIRLHCLSKWSKPTQSTRHTSAVACSGPAECMVCLFSIRMNSIASAFLSLSITPAQAHTFWHIQVAWNCSHAHWQCFHKEYNTCQLLIITNVELLLLSSKFNEITVDTNW